MHRLSPLTIILTNKLVIGAKTLKRIWFNDICRGAKILRDNPDYPSVYATAARPDPRQSYSKISFKLLSYPCEGAVCPKSTALMY